MTHKSFFQQSKNRKTQIFSAALHHIEHEDSDETEDRSERSLGASCARGVGDHGAGRRRRRDRVVGAVRAEAGNP